MKQNYLERKYHLRMSDFDMRSRLFPATVLDLLQDMAAEHAAALGRGYYDLLPEHKCWMLLRTRYEVVRHPDYFSDVVVRTWPVESKRLEFDRDYMIYDTEGNVLVRATSQWAIMDISDREAPRFVPARDYDLGVEEYIGERAIEGRFPRLSPVFEPQGEPYVTKSGYSDIDTNGHVNNIKYSNFILNALALPPEKEISSFRIDYIKEIKSGSEITILHRTDGNTVTCRGEADGEVKFTARLEMGSGQ